MDPKQMNPAEQEAYRRYQRYNAVGQVLARLHPLLIGAPVVGAVLMMPVSLIQALTIGLAGIILALLVLLLRAKLLDLATLEIEKLQGAFEREQKHK